MRQASSGSRESDYRALQIPAIDPVSRQLAEDGDRKGATVQIEKRSIGAGVQCLRGNLSIVGFEHRAAIEAKYEPAPRAEG